MYARITSFTIKSEFNNDVTERQMNDDLPAKIRAIPGIQQTFHLGKREDCKCAVVSIYDTKESAEAAIPAVQAIWANYTHMLAGPPTPEEYGVMVHVSV